MSTDPLSIQGFALIPGVLATSACQAIAEHIPRVEAASGSTRNLLQQNWCTELADTLRAHATLTRLIPANHVAMQCTYFEKSADRNWLVTVHQDLSIPARERLPDPDFQGWSEKEGELFVQAPVRIMEQVLAVRLHLDPCGPHDGPLRVVPGTHQRGVIDAQHAIALRNACGEVVCEAAPGTVLAMRPLLLHASSKATGNSRRRVLHFLFGPPQSDWCQPAKASMASA